MTFLCDCHTGPDPDCHPRDRKFNKNENNWLHKHFEPQQVDVVVSSIQILALESLIAFARTPPLTPWVSEHYDCG